MEKYENDKFMRIDDLREILDISRTVADRLCAMPDFPSLKIGRKAYIDKEKFYIWLANNINKTVITSLSESEPDSDSDLESENNEEQKDDSRNATANQGDK